MTTGSPRQIASPRRRILAVGARSAGAVVALLLAAGGSARAGQIVAVYQAYWAGLPAAEIRLDLSDGDGSYRDRIEIRTEGLPRLVTHFRGTAQADGRLAAGRPADPSQYDALYNLRKRHDSHISMRFVGRGNATIAERGAGDTSRKPPLAERFRRDAVDPMTAIERLRAGDRRRRRESPLFDPGLRRRAALRRRRAGPPASRIRRTARCGSS